MVFVVKKLLNTLPTSQHAFFAFRQAGSHWSKRFSLHPSVLPGEGLGVRGKTLAGSRGAPMSQGGCVSLSVKEDESVIKHTRDTHAMFFE